MASKLAAHNVVVTGAQSSGFIQDILSWVIPLGIFYLMWMFFFRRVAERQGLGGLMAIGKSRAKVYVETDTKVTFKDVAGVDEARVSLEQPAAKRLFAAATSKSLPQALPSTASDRRPSSQ